MGERLADKCNKDFIISSNSIAIGSARGSDKFTKFTESGRTTWPQVKYTKITGSKTEINDDLKAELLTIRQSLPKNKNAGGRKKTSGNVDPELLSIKQNLIKNKCRSERGETVARRLKHSDRCERHGRRNLTTAVNSGRLSSVTATEFRTRGTVNRSVPTKSENKTSTTSDNSDGKEDESFKVVIRESFYRCRQKAKPDDPTVDGDEGEDDDKVALGEDGEALRTYDPPAEGEEDEALADGAPPDYPEDIELPDHDVARSLEADEEHMHPCYCDIPQAVKKRIAIEEDHRALRHQLLKKRLLEFREAIRLKREAEEKAEEQADPDAFTDVIIATPEGMVRKRKRRKGPKRKKMVKGGKFRTIGKKVINWRGKPKIPVRSTRASKIRKETRSYCKWFPRQELPWCVDWRKEPIYCWRTNTNFDVRQCFNAELRKQLEDFYFHYKCKKPWVGKVIV